MRSALIFFICLLPLPGLADDFHGMGRLWFTLAALPVQVSGSAGRTPGMERFPEAQPGLSGLRTECYGQADAQGLGKGICVTTALDGAIWVETYVCSKAVLPPEGAISACSGTSTVVGGTGRFAAISGSSSFTMLTTMIAPDGMQVVYAPGETRLHW
jgi:hypothetical protein